MEEEVDLSTLFAKKKRPVAPMPEPEPEPQKKRKKKKKVVDDDEDWDTDADFVNEQNDSKWSATKTSPQNLPQTRGITDRKPNTSRTSLLWPTSPRQVAAVIASATQTATAQRQVALSNPWPTSLHSATGLLAMVLVLIL